MNLKDLKPGVKIRYKDGSLELEFIEFYQYTSYPQFKVLRDDLKENDSGAIVGVDRDSLKNFSVFYEVEGFEV